MFLNLVIFLNVCYIFNGNLVTKAKDLNNYVAEPMDIPVHVIYDSMVDGNIGHSVPEKNQKANVVYENENERDNNGDSSAVSTIKYQSTTTISSTTKKNQLQQFQQKVQMMFQTFLDKINNYNSSVYQNIVDPVNNSMSHILTQIQHNATNYQQMISEQFNKLSQFMNNIIHKPIKPPQQVIAGGIVGGAYQSEMSETQDSQPHSTSGPNSNLIQSIKDTFQNFLGKLNKTIDEQIHAQS